ncbi:MAG: TetR/AcrR family transcriptional regulator [Actinobacteria bacterium]|nr:TetR/AcrR family transcriptional regulator [Actinomycetota bacterium]
MRAPVTRQQILDSALGLMAHHGFVAMSMRELASACGCNVAILYRHFESKEAILEAVVAERRRRVFIFLGEGIRSNDRVIALRDDLWRATEQAYRRWLLTLFPQLHGRRELRAIARTIRTLVQGAYGELVMVPGDRRRALRARSKELAKVIAPALGPAPAPAPALV